MSVGNPYEIGLDRNQANFAAVTPLSAWGAPPPSIRGGSLPQMVPCDVPGPRLTALPLCALSTANGTSSRWSSARV